MDKAATLDQLQRIIKRFITIIGRDCPEIVTSSNLNEDVGLSSDEGVCLVLEISEEFGIEIPEDFNAVVHEDGTRARTLDELADCVICFGGVS